jgi:murein DD-endopeptidase MepM/ murein hydrolase activator NlpD
MLGVLVMVTGVIYAGTRTWLAEFRHSSIHEEIRSLEQSSQANRARLESLIASEASARLISGLPSIHPDVRQVGVGGRAVLPDPGFSPDSPFYRASRLHSEMETSKRKSSLSLKSMEDIERQIREVDDRWQYVPSITPVTGVITSRYGPRNDPFTGLYAMHYGIDIAAALGTPVRSPARGVVSRTGVDARYGLYIDVDHQNGFKTRFGHLSVILVKKGMVLDRGDVIGKVGETGRATGHHLHYEVHKDRRWVNPMKYIQSENDC